MTTEKQRWPRATAILLADEIKSELEPFCERIEIAGSLRREKLDVGDIEILYVPKFEDRQADMFTTEPYDIANEKISEWLNNGTISKRPGVDGRFTWGLKNKLAIHRDGIPIDFFATTIPCWWVSLVIRTGGKESNLKLTNGAIAKGMHLNAYGEGVTLQNKTVIPATSEHHVFDLCGVTYSEPKYRA